MQMGCVLEAFGRRKKNGIKRLPSTTSSDKCDDDSDDGDRFDDKTTAVTDDDCHDSDASFVSVCACVFS